MKIRIIILIFLGLAITAVAGDPVSVLIREAGSATDYPTSDLLILFDSTLTEVQETGLSYVTNHTLYKVLTPEGARQLSVLTFGYDPQSAYVEIRAVIVYRKDGQREEMDITRVYDYPAPARAIYWGAREKMIEIGRLEPEDAVEVVMFRKGFTYALLAEDNDRYIPPMRGHFYDIVEFFGPNPVREKVYTVKIPRTKTLQFEFYNGEVGVSGWIEGDAFVYTFSKKGILPVKREAGMVALSDIAPKLLLSTSPDWFAKSIWFYGVNEDFVSFETTPAITEKVHEILKNAKTEEDSISLLTHWCADEIRYSGISMGEGEGFTLHTGDMTFTDRCGVCKDKAGMLITMLRAAGFESYAAMTMAGSRIDYIPADQFNHSVTVVKRRDGTYQLLDPTWVPFVRELWSSAEQQQQYLMGLPEGADLGTTPISDPENHFVKITGTSTLLANGTLNGTLTEVQETGLSYVPNHTLYKVLTPEGARQLSVLTFGYDPQSAYVEIRAVIVYRKDGQREEIDITRVYDYPAPARAIYWGAREKMMEIGRLEPEDVVEVVMFRKGFTYALLAEDDDRYIPPMRGHFYDIVEFFGPNPVREKVYTVKIPRTKTLQFEFYNGEVGVSGWIEGDAFVYTFSKKGILPVKREAGMVALSDIAPKLLLSTSPDWFAKSIWFYGVNEDFGSFETTPAITEKVNEILKNAKTEEDSISLLTHWCADEIRYSGISMGEGEGFTLHTGDMTFTDRCGVCKDKAGMLITMLRAAGFESYAAMTMAGSRIDYIPADQFNHSVTVVKRRDGTYQLLDPTWVPFVRELWSSAEQQQQYLMGLPEGADLGTTPISDPENHFVKITGTSTLLANGTLNGTLTITAEGQSDASLRSYFRYSAQSYWNQVVERELLRIHPGCRIVSLDYGNPLDYLREPVTIMVEYMIPDYAVVAGNTLFFTPLLAKNPFQNTQSHLNINTSLNERIYPFRDRCSRMVSIRETIQLPEIKSIIRLPESVSQLDPAAAISGGYTLDGNTLVFEENIVLEKRIYEPGDWPAVKTVVIHQKRFSDQPVIVELNH